jgi:hypothetical protein
MAGKSEKQIETLATSIQTLRALGFKPAEAAGKLKADEPSLRKAFIDPFEAAQRVLKKETGKTTPIADIKERVTAAGASVAFQQEVLKSKVEEAPAPRQEQTELQTLLAERKNIERKFPGITEFHKRRQELKETIETKRKETKELVESAYDFTSGARKLNLFNNFSGVIQGIRAVGITGRGGTFGELLSTQQELEEYEMKSRQSAKYLNKDTLKILEENTEAINKLTRSLNSNTSAQGGARQ